MLIPLLFMGDIVGRLFREFAVTLSVTILVSAVVSLTLTPMMCAKLLQHTAGARAEPLLPAPRSASSSGSSTATAARSPGCSSTRPPRCVVAVATLALTVLLYVVIPKGFFPVQDTA